MYKNMTTNFMVENVDQAIKFYQGILGFSVDTTVPGKNNELQFAILSKDSIMLMFEEKNALIEEYPVLSTPKVQPSVSLYITPDNFDELYEDIKSKYHIHKEQHTTFYGTREFAITDADGYVLVFAKNND